MDDAATSSPNTTHTPMGNPGQVFDGPPNYHSARERQHVPNNNPSAQNAPGDNNAAVDADSDYDASDEDEWAQVNIHHLEYIHELAAGDLVQFKPSNDDSIPLRGGTVLDNRKPQKQPDGEFADGKVTVRIGSGLTVQVSWADIVELEPVYRIHHLLTPNHPVLTFARSLSPDDVFQFRFRDRETRKWSIGVARVRSNVQAAGQIICVGISSNPEGAVFQLTYSHVLPWKTPVGLALDSGSWDRVDAARMSCGAIRLVAITEDVHMPITTAWSWIPKETNKAQTVPSNQRRSLNPPRLLEQQTQRPTQGKKRHGDDLSIGVNFGIPQAGEKRIRKPPVRLLESTAPSNVGRVNGTARKTGSQPISDQELREPSRKRRHVTAGLGDQPDVDDDEIQPLSLSEAAQASEYAFLGRFLLTTDWDSLRRHSGANLARVQQDVEDLQRRADQDPAGFIQLWNAMGFGELTKNWLRETKRRI